MCFFVSSRRFSFRQFDEVFSQARRTAATTQLGFRVNGRGREVAVGRATGRLGRDARDPPRRARHGRLESPSDDRSIGQGRTRAFSSDRHREGTSRETTRATRTSPFFSCATTSGVTRSTATPRSDPILPRGDATGTRRARLEVTEAGEGGASPAVFLVALATERVARWFLGLTRSPLFSKTQL